MRSCLDSSSVAPVGHAYPVLLATLGGLLLTGLAVTAKVPVTYAGALVVAVTPGIGPAAAVGGAAGVVIHDLFRGAAGVWTASVAIWVLAFAGLVASFGTASVRQGRPRHSRRAAVGRCLVAVVLAGLFAAALAAWVATAAGGQRFYIAAAGFLSGIPVAAGAGVAVTLLVHHASPASGTARADGQPTHGRREPDGGSRVARGIARPSARTALGLLVVGLGWLVGGILLDLVAHDLAVFGTEQELQQYAAGIAGRQSLAGAVVSTGLLAVYRYGEAAVLVSAPLAAGMAWAVYRWGRRAGREDDR